jgi:hypothetical protein
VYSSHCSEQSPCKSHVQLLDEGFPCVAQRKAEGISTRRSRDLCPGPGLLTTSCKEGQHLGTLRLADPMGSRRVARGPCVLLSRSSKVYCTHIGGAYNFIFSNKRVCLVPKLFHGQITERRCVEKALRAHESPVPPFYRFQPTNSQAHPTHAILASSYKP